MAGDFVESSNFMVRSWSIISSWPSVAVVDHGDEGSGVGGSGVAGTGSGATAQMAGGADIGESLKSSLSTPPTGFDHGVVTGESHSTMTAVVTLSMSSPPSSYFPSALLGVTCITIDLRRQIIVPGVLTYTSSLRTRCTAGCGT